MSNLDEPPMSIQRQNDAKSKAYDACMEGEWIELMSDEDRLDLLKTMWHVRTRNDELIDKSFELIYLMDRSAETKSVKYSEEKWQDYWEAN